MFVLLLQFTNVSMIQWILIQMRSFKLVERTLNPFPNLIVIKARLFLIQEICFFFIRNLCRLYKFLPLHNLSQNN